MEGAVEEGDLFAGAVEAGLLQDSLGGDGGGSVLSGDVLVTWAGDSFAAGLFKAHLSIVEWPSPWVSLAYIYTRTFRRNF